MRNVDKVVIAAPVIGGILVIVTAICGNDLLFWSTLVIQSAILSYTTGWRHAQMRDTAVYKRLMTATEQDLLHAGDSLQRRPHAPPRTAHTIPRFDPEKKRRVAERPCSWCGRPIWRDANAPMLQWCDHCRPVGSEAHDEDAQ
jgi:hypothetical protein